MFEVYVICDKCHKRVLATKMTRIGGVFNFSFPAEWQTLTVLTTQKETHHRCPHCREKDLTNDHPTTA